MSSHESNKELTVDWLTPKYIIDAFPCFDLDPCSSVNQQWNTAKVMIRLPDDGLSIDWFGRVWLNPPYGAKQIQPWMEKIAKHGNGIALVFARTETKWFHEYVWPFASGMLFFKGRLSYIHGRALSERAKYGANAASPSVLISYGQQCCQLLRDCQLDGHFIECNSVLLEKYSQTQLAS